MSNVSGKSAPGRQSQLPFSRAFIISMNSLKMRFGRSLITAGGIFLGIAFFAVVNTQSLMQWPTPQKIAPGYVRIGGQVISPNDYNTWKPVPVDVGREGGIPEDVVERVARGGEDFDLGIVVRGQLRAVRADKKLALLKKEWKGLEKVKPTLTFYLDAFADKDLKASDAIKAGVPSNLAKKLAGKKKTFKGSDLANELREDSHGITSLYVSAVLDQDISIGDAVKAGVPETVAKRLAGTANVFRAGPLNDAITAQPDLIKTTQDLADHYSIYKDVPQSAVDKLGAKYAYSLTEMLDNAKGFAKDARRWDVMIVNKDRRVSTDMLNEARKAETTKLVNGDYVLVPDKNSYYRTWWLIIMSLLVCTVGITNSMLMSVTERFKEIGTMKCLGALDSFVVLLFMLESGMMGIVASVLGWAAGSLTILLAAGFTKGWDILGSLSLVGILSTFGASLGVGIVLTIIATIAPALRAANMPAAVALRSEI